MRYQSARNPAFNLQKWRMESTHLQYCGQHCNLILKSNIWRESIYSLDNDCAIGGLKQGLKNRNQDTDS